MYYVYTYSDIIERISVIKSVTIQYIIPRINIAIEIKIITVVIEARQ